MSEQITVTLPNETKQALDELMRRDGLSADQVIEKAIKASWFSARLHELRAKIVPKAAAQGIITDEDVFDIVS